VNEPCSSGSDRPGILPARRPCFTTAKLSLGKPNKEIPEAKTLLLFTKEEHFSLSLSFEAKAFTGFRIPICCGFLQHSTLVVDKAVAMSTKVDVLSGYFRMRLKREKK